MGSATASGRPDRVRSRCRAGSCRERKRRCGPNPVKSAGQVRLPLGDSHQGACSCPGRRHRRCHWRLHPARFPSGGAGSMEVSDRGTGRSVAPAGSSSVVCGGEQVLVVAPDGVAVEDVQVSVAGGCRVVVGLECRLAAQPRVTRTGSGISVGEGAAARVEPADLVGAGAARQDSNERALLCGASAGRCPMRHETERADRGPCDLGPHVCEVPTGPALAVHVGLLRFDYASMLAAV